MLSVRGKTKLSLSTVLMIGTINWIGMMTDLIVLSDDSGIHHHPQMSLSNLTPEFVIGFVLIILLIIVARQNLS